MSGDIVERLRQSTGFKVHHTDDGPVITADIELLSEAADEIVRLRAALRYIERPTMSLGGADPEQHVLVADERTVRLALQTCIRMAREALAVEEARRG